MLRTSAPQWEVFIVCFRLTICWFCFDFVWFIHTADTQTPCMVLSPRLTLVSIQQPSAPLSKEAKKASELHTQTHKPQNHCPDNPFIIICELLDCEKQ